MNINKIEDILYVLYLMNICYALGLILYFLFLVSNI